MITLPQRTTSVIETGFPISRVATSATLDENIGHVLGTNYE